MGGVEAELVGLLGRSVFFVLVVQQEVINIIDKVILTLIHHVLVLKDMLGTLDGLEGGVSTKVKVPTSSNHAIPLVARVLLIHLLGSEAFLFQSIGFGEDALFALRLINQRVLLETLIL